MLSSTSALSTKLATKQQFWENMTCWHVLFWKRKDSFKKQNIDKISLQKGLTIAKSAASECSSMRDAQPAAVYPATPDDPSRNLKFGFWSEHHRIYFLTIVLSTVVAVGMKFDPTCRQRNLSSTTALIFTICFDIIHLAPAKRRKKKIYPGVVVYVWRERYSVVSR